MLTLYYTFAYPYFTYCIQVWGKTYISNCNKLVLLQKRLIRIISGSSYLAHTAPLYKEINLLKLDEIYQYMTLLFMYKYHNKMLPKAFNDMFILNSSIHSYGTRQLHHYNLPYCRTNLTKQTIKFTGPAIWNSLPDSFHRIPMFNSFKMSVKRFILNNRP